MGVSDGPGRVATALGMLITQRSQVQILPPLPRQEALFRTGRGPFACSLCTDFVHGARTSGPCGAAGPLSASPDQDRSHDTHADTAQGRLPRHPLASARPLRLGRTAGIASQWLRQPRPATTRQDSAPAGKDGQTSCRPWPSVRYGRPEAPGGSRRLARRQHLRGDTGKR
jgi:hypothetical protein